MKTLHRFWPNQFYKIITGAILSGLCLSSFSQTTPLATPKKIDYPGILQTFEKLISIDNEKVEKRTNALLKNGKVYNEEGSVSNLELEPNFLNSIILHSDPGYLHVASTSKCRFYETIMTDLLRSSQGKIQNVLVTYTEKNSQESSVMSKKDFLNRVVKQQCPETQKNIEAFQIKILDETLNKINFDIPTGIAQCRNVHVNWINDPKTPFLCQIHEYVKEAKAGGGDPKDLRQRIAVAKILEQKQTLLQKDYIENLCQNLDDPKLFCEEFLNVSFWTKIAAGRESTQSIEGICQKVSGSSSPSNIQFNACLSRLKKEKDLCLYPGGSNTGLRPQPDCDFLSTALNHSSLKIDYKDCPGSSDQMIATNMGRIINHFDADEPPAVEGNCSGISSALTFNFNKKFDNDENWKLEACYEDKISEREVCYKTFFGKVGNWPESYTSVVAKILQKTRGADSTLTCKMLSSQQYNPLRLEYKSGCFIIYEPSACFISNCEHKILYNNNPIDFIKVKNKVTLAYFPLSVREERFSQQYLLTHDYKKSGKALTNLTSLTKFVQKKSNGIVHGTGCAEDLLPTFFKAQALNQCTPLPFIINGMVKDGKKTVFVVRTAADSVDAPRLISWSLIYSAVKSYQTTHPLKQWTMYGLD